MEKIFDFMIILLIDITKPIDYLLWKKCIKTTFDSVSLFLRFLLLCEIIKYYQKKVE